MTNFRKSNTPVQKDDTATTPLLSDVAATEPSVTDPAKPAPVTAPSAMRSGSKGAALLELLQRGEGASLDEMIERTGWQGHTVRAAMTGFRKKGHAIDKRMPGNCTVWFIAA